MALHIVLDRNHHQNNHKQVHLPFTDLKGIPAEDVVKVQADGHELEYIKQAFTNLPMRVGSPQTPGGLVVSWYDDLAKFIVGNL